MASIRLSASGLADIERLATFLRESDVAAAAGTAQVIMEGLGILMRHPLVGRPLEGGRRELVIHRGRAGYLAQYSYDALADEIVVVALRHQREVDPD